MGNLLQQRRTPREYAGDAQVIEIKSKIDYFKQLTKIVEADLSALDAGMMPTGWRDRDVTAALTFGFLDAQHSLPALQGQVAATIDVVCQRCLEPFALPLATDLRLLFQGEDAVEKDGEEYEVWELDSEELAISDLIEEALIMTIPFVAMHDSDKCCAAAEELHDAAEKKTLPFADLKRQMEQEN